MKINRWPCVEHPESSANPKGRCRACNAAWSREHYRTHGRTGGFVNRNAELRAEMIEAYGPACACCGETWNPFLQLDHPNDDGAERRRAVGGQDRVQSEWRKLKREGFPPGVLQVLCANCHNAKTRKSPCPEGHRLSQR